LLASTSSVKVCGTPLTCAWGRTAVV